MRARLAAASTARWPTRSSSRPPSGAAPRSSTAVALTGGVLPERTAPPALHRCSRGRGFDVLTHRLVPPNDGGLALGQAFIAAHRRTGRRTDHVSCRTGPDPRDPTGPRHPHGDDRLRWDPQGGLPRLPARRRDRRLRHRPRRLRHLQDRRGVGAGDPRTVPSSSVSSTTSSDATGHIDRTGSGTTGP